MYICNISVAATQDRNQIMESDQSTIMKRDGERQEWEEKLRKRKHLVFAFAAHGNEQKESPVTDDHVCLSPH